MENKCKRESISRTSKPQNILKLSNVKELQEIAEPKRNLLLIIFCSLIHPDSKFKVTWDLIVIILSVYNSILIPYEFAYSIKPNMFLVILDRMIDATFIVDIFINFKTIYKDSHTDELVTDAK